VYSVYGEINTTTTMTMILCASCTSPSYC